MFFQSALQDFFLSSFSFISSHTAYVTVLQLAQLRVNRRAEIQMETGLRAHLSVTRMHLQQTLNSSNMVNVGHGKQKTSLIVCGLRSSCHCLASCSVRVCVYVCVYRSPKPMLALSPPNLDMSQLVVLGLPIFCETCLNLGRV